MKYGYLFEIKWLFYKKNIFYILKFFSFYIFKFLVVSFLSVVFLKYNMNIFFRKIMKNFNLNCSGCGC